MSKFVLQFRLVGDLVPIQDILSTAPDESASDVWPDEYQLREGTTIDDTPVVSGHIPCNSQSAAEAYYNDLLSLDGVSDSADAGYLHVHECPTRGGDDVWDCSERVIVKTEA